MDYLNEKLPIEQRIDDLISRMTIDEKLDEIDQDIMSIDWDKLPAQEAKKAQEELKARTAGAHTYNLLQRYALEHTRLHIPFFIHEEALHGLFRPGCTVFPQQMTLGQTFEPELCYKMGRAIATEARARGIHETWNPVLDLARDPRWGRTEETYGEDTYLSSEMGVQVVKGLQDDDLARNDTVASELKHFTGYGNPVGGLNCAPSTMGRHDVYAYAMPVFEKAFIKGKATNTMCSYNSIDSVPVVSDHEILTDILRDKWGMPGFVRSDMTAIIMQHTAHFTAQTPKEAFYKGVKAGVDIQLADYSHEDFRKYYKELISEKRLSQDDLDLSVRRVLRVKFMLGLFENPYIDEDLQNKVTRCKKHVDTALEIAKKGAVLLKNKDNLLPLSKNIKKVAVVGPTADRAAFGDYTKNPEGFEAVTLLEGVRRTVSPDTEVLYAKGCNVLGSGIKPVPRWWVNAVPCGDITADDYGFTAEYFNGDNFDSEPVLKRLDKQIDFNWIFLKPDESIDTNKFCVRWRGYMHVEKSFTGRIGLSSPDSMRLYIDSKLIVDGWDDKDANVMVDFDFEAGRKYDVTVEFRNDARGARVIFGYDHGEENMDAAAELVKSADVAIVAVGDSEETSGENFDRTDLNLPGSQLLFVKKMYETGTPIVLVINTGRSVSLTWENDNIPAILQAGFNGEMGGLAAAQIIFGDVYPSGRLTLSYPKSVGQIPCHYSRHPAGGRLYIESDWNPLFPFGYGLTYTDFEYSNLRLSKNIIKSDEEIIAYVDVKNIGNNVGEEVVQMYINDCFSSVVKPIKELKGFKKIALNPGETKTVLFTIGNEAMRTLDSSLNWVVEPGDFEVQIGKNAADIILTDTFKVI